MKVTSKDLYAILRELLAPVAKAAGCKRLKTGVLGWTRPERDRHLSFWFQCDKYGWFDDFGSKFTLEFQLAARPEAGAGTWKERSRFAQLLDSQELESVRAINNGILQGLPEPGPANPVSLLPQEQRGWFMSDYRPALEPYHKDHDVWLHYFARRDVEVWASFLQPRLVRVMDEFVVRVDQGRAG